MEEEPQLVLANKIVDNMVAVIKEVGKCRRMVSIENPRGSTLWSYPAIMELTDSEVLVLVKSVTTKKSLGARSIKASDSRFNYRASPKSII